jgi:nitrogen fixation/metabolism regulation signal transduction histidine kinase
LGCAVCAAVAPARRGAADRAVDEAARTAPDLALIDLDPSADGSEDEVLEAAERLAGSTDLPVICLTDGVDGSRLRRARRTAPFGFVLKPFAARQLQLTIESALAWRDREHRRTTDQSDRQSRLLETEARLRRTIDDLRRQTHLMETVFDSLSDGVVVVDNQGAVGLFNQGAERILGRAMLAVGPDRWGEVYGLFHPDQVTPFAADDLPTVRAIRGEASENVEMYLQDPAKPDGGLYVSVSGRPLKPGNGGVVVFRDVTERMVAQEAVSRAFAQGRLEVVETILHNIGNAINSVAVGVGTIREKILHNEAIHRMFALADALLAHQDDWITYLRTDPQGRQAMPFILALAEDLGGWHEGMRTTVERVESRVAHIVDIIHTHRSFDRDTSAAKDIDLHEAILAAVGLLEDALTNRGIDLRVDCRRAPRRILVPESAFHQVLVNLVRNGIEAIDRLAGAAAPDRPCIRVDAYLQDHPRRGRELTLDVSDNGIGIEPERASVIFLAGHTTKNNGSGIGLRSAANFIASCGGTIRALSDGAGAGATIRMTLPADA